MFHYCASVLLEEVNRYIQSKLKSVEEDVVFFSALERSLAVSTPPRYIVMRLVDIVSVELSSSPHEYFPQGSSFIVRKKPEAFSLYFLFSMVHQEDNCLKNLELLAHVAAFFQHKSYFDVCNTPILQQMGVENFSVELVKLNASERFMLWASLYVPYTPSLLYKVGLIFVEDATMGRYEVPRIEQLD